MKRKEHGRMSQDEHPQKCARARHKARTKEGGNNALGRHCADKARHTTREQEKISILRGSQNIPFDWDSPKDMLETL